MSTSASFNKIKQILSNIKNQIDSFQDKVNNLSSDNAIIHDFKFKYNKYRRYNSVVSDFDDNNLTREEKINLFNQKRTERIEDIKKQINFVDYIFSEESNNESQTSKIKTIKGVLSNKEYDLNESDINSICDAIISNDEGKKEQLLEELTHKETNDNTPQDSLADLILTQDFLSKLKKEGKEISTNFEIKSKENVDNECSWLDDGSLELQSNQINKNNGSIDKEDFINLLNKK